MAKITPKRHYANPASSQDGKRQNGHAKPATLYRPRYTGHAKMSKARLLAQVYKRPELGKY